MGLYWEICWSKYSHRLIYPLWSVQGCELFPSPFPSHKVLECLPPGTLLPGWSVCIVKFKIYFNDLVQCCLDVELKFSLSCRRTLWLCSWLFYYVTSVLQGIQDWRTPTLKATQFVAVQKYRVIHKSLRDFWPLWYSSRDGHTGGEHVNRGRDTPSFCPTLQVLNMSTFGDPADVNSVMKFLPQHCNIWQSIAATASTILCGSCGKAYGIGGMYTRSLM